MCTNHHSDLGEPCCHNLVSMSENILFSTAMLMFVDWPICLFIGPYVCLLAHMFSVTKAVTLTPSIPLSFLLSHGPHDTCTLFPQPSRVWGCILLTPQSCFVISFGLLPGIPCAPFSHPFVFILVASRQAWRSSSCMGG